MNRVHSRRSALAATLAGLALALTACGGGGGSQASRRQQLGHVAQRCEIQGRDRDRHGGHLQALQLPRGGAGDLTGYDVEIAAVAGKLGVKARFQETPLDGIFAGLGAKRYDTVANQVTINPERKAGYGLCTPYTCPRA